MLGFDAGFNKLTVLVIAPLESASWEGQSRERIEFGGEIGAADTSDFGLTGSLSILCRSKSLRKYS
jgi:hypothetical protein